ncbi:hypothetical protein Fbal_3711 [Ferrimonas balearica DSM 9799]|uniref:Uncharacterized protein n=1 Tax=Ferrimonas balearica (strain DSM 9799 / CCM 4581 / KCTC 23876 / PAT) TaxID=550540 RepID=E1SQD5_FERBD|nr:hypothetical protein [Ferrimonas balearica]ADN77906.1 hypothetical protein Fbal_3711 [Ferrimonas balearica DSM 9799]
MKMKAERKITEAKKAKLGGMTKLRAAYLEAKAEGRVRSCRITGVRLSL